jgi:23S rRNA (adenine2030-N6)-methyltransferase
MNYRHLFHAGNFADAFKHIVLVALTQSFFKKETPFCYLDTHAGIGQYDLLSDAAQKCKEYENGIEKILMADNAPALVQDYLSCIQKPLRLYPGSPDIVKKLLRPQDRMVLCELHPEDAKTLKTHFSHDKQITVNQQDAYQSLKAYLPPKEKRGLVLIDPPYENKNEFSNILSALVIALKRFETGVYAIWYPIKDYKSILHFHQQLKNTITRPLLACEITLYPDDIKTQLNGCGMIIINPPFKLDERLNETLPWLWKTLSIHNQGSHQLKFL